MPCAATRTRLRPHGRFRVFASKQPQRRRHACGKQQPHDAFVRIAMGAQQHPRGGIWHCSRPTALSRPMLTVPEPPPRPAAPNARAPCRWTARGCGSCPPAHALLPMALQQRRRRRPTSNHAVGATLRPRDAPAARPSRDFYFYCRRRRHGERGLIQNGICCAGVSRAAAEKCAHGMQ
jgi:hypothetical protein